MPVKLSKVLPLAAIVPLVLVLAAPGHAQVRTEVPPVVPGAKPVTAERIKIHGTALEGNLEGDAVDREVIVFLPPSYQTERNRRYPVVYALHGYSVGAEQWSREIHVPQTIEGAFALGAKEMIVVVPDSKTLHNGSMYSSSVTTGDFRKFVAEDLVQYVDGHYRTIANRGGRGLAGHSMGGYGTWVIGMSYPQVFDSIWAQSACCVSPRGETVESATAMSNVKIEGVDQSGFGMRAGLASMTAWSPNPQNPPFYADFPLKDGAVDPLVIAKWANNSPLAMVASHIGALKSFDAIGSDVGTKDGLIRDDTLIHEELARFGIAHEWATYEGTHTDKIGQRFDEVVLPFFAKHLAKQ